MRRLLSNIALFLITLLLISCSGSVSDLSKKDVSLNIENEHLLVKNNFNHSIYYFAVESGVAAQINWAPLSTEENRVRPGRLKSIPLDSIHAYDPGEEILFYYWSQKEPKNNNIKFQSIQSQ
ncbi:hypothetical protein [Rhodohalobacter sulfatireducens]|uniref:Lipoprotein n=1 Tax=Rhodohalobacter sulfatireducens TaxID=2911366 RepID=A0ABS9KDY6_9BACT|nr:hypothetical protein [Rhodohalobacter sulfatireducens]MCG2589048.1 hypothetical protein [Rhodohalobacter sulfatireducens]